MVPYITLFKPKELNFEEIIKENEPKFSYKIDKFFYIISLILELKCLIRFDEENPNPYTPISSQKLKKIVWNYDDYLIYLVEQKILETDNHYIPNEKSRGYRFTSKYSVDSSSYILTDEKLIYKIKAQEKEKEKINKLEKSKDFVIKQIEWFQHLAIDIESALTRMFKLCEEQEKDKILKYRISNYQVSILKIHERRYSFTLDTTSYRFHSNLTNLKKEFRQYLNCDGEKLIGIDISNSQPYLTLVLLSKEFYLNEKTGKNLI